MSEYSDKALMDAAQRCVNTYAKIANRKFKCNLPIYIPMKYDLQDTDPKTGATASSTMLIDTDPKIGATVSSLILIRLNMILYRDNVDSYLNQVIPHELSHLVQHSVFNLAGVHTQSHGAEWQEIMRRLGKDPHKSHNFDTSKAVAHYKALKKAKKIG